MHSIRSARLCLAALALVAVVQNAWYWASLPNRVATHFGIQGQPDAWMSKAAAISTMLLFQLGMPLFLLGVVALSRRLPTSMVNIPNRDYWLHEDRRHESLDYVQTIMSWVAVAMASLGIVINHLTFVANRERAALQLTYFLIALGLFLLAVFSLVGRMAWHFRLPKP